MAHSRAPRRATPVRRRARRTHRAAPAADHQAPADARSRGPGLGHPLGQRRIWAAEAAPLRSFEERLRELIDTVEANAGERDVLARYHAAIEAETARAQQDRWADERTFAFDRVFPAPRKVLWRHWAEPDLLASWWAPRR